MILHCVSVYLSPHKVTGLTMEGRINAAVMEHRD